jgi:SecD/SecF fusion protein
MTTVITSLFLIGFGTEEVKGFGITLIIGILASLFTALFVTRTIFSVLIEKFGVRQLNSLPLTYPKWDKLLRPNIDWMRLAPGFIIFSAITITIGTILFAVKAHQGQMMDIEFASGTSVQFELKEPMQIHDVRKLVEKADPNMLPSPSVISIGSDQKTYEIVTPLPDAIQVKEAVLKSMVGSDGKSLLNAEVPSTFTGSSQPIKPLAEVLNKQVIPITPENSGKGSTWPGAFRPADLRDFSPGVAIYLDNLDPPLTPGQIKDRVTQQQLQSTSGSSVRQEFVVESPDGDTSRPTTSAVVLATNPTLSYTKDPGTWQQLLADPLWKLVNEGVARPAQLQQVKNFDAAVAGDAQRDAFMALVFSILVIMAYIWVRFGNLKYGTATVIALLHDTLFTIAALGFSHYLVYVPGLRQLLELEPFRINLTVVAGILTIMGYSMIDTIVVFDRIREIRGKFGHVSRQVINDAINQTLSRTLLTAGTTTITVAIMYFVGGPGIHGFTFVLLVGILVGTYSSIAIAAPFLLIGGGEKNVQNPTARTTAKLQRAGV